MAEPASTTHPDTTAGASIRSHLSLLRRYWWFIALVVLVAVGATFLLTQRQARVYSASARVLLRTNSSISLFPYSATGPYQLIRIAETESLFVQSPDFTALARELSPAGPRVSAAGSGNEIVFTARGAVPADVAEAANVWAQTYVTERQAAFQTETESGIAFLQDTMADLAGQRDDIRADVAEFDDLLARTSDAEQYSRILSQKLAAEALLQPQLAPLERQIADFGSQLAELELVTLFFGDPDVSARVVSTARPPTSPVSPNLTRNLLVGGLLGLALGVGPPYLLRAVNDKVEDNDDVVESTQLPILATIPGFEHKQDHSIEVLDQPGSVASERYQGLLTAIEFASIGQRISSILVTSAAPGDGKTTTAANLAALASRYMNVLLVDADMRRPRVHELFDRSNDVGLSDVLIGKAQFFDARMSLERSGTRLDLLTAGSVTTDPALLLRGDAWPTLLAEFFLYDLVIIDAPPVLAVTDGLLLGRAVGAQILVSRSGATTREDLVEATELLRSNGTRTLGVVINRQTARRRYYGEYYNEYQSATK